MADRLTEAREQAWTIAGLAYRQVVSEGASTKDGAHAGIKSHPATRTWRDALEMWVRLGGAADEGAEDIDEVIDQAPPLHAAS